MAEIDRIQHLFFDLDDTLIDTSGEIIPQAVLETCTAMIEAGIDASVDDLIKFRSSLFRKVPHRDFFDECGKHFRSKGKIPLAQVIEAGRLIFYQSNDSRLMKLKNSMHSRQAIDFLKTAQTRYTIHIVTSGDEPTQRRKIYWSELEPFAESFTCVHAHQAGAKGQAFSNLVSKINLPPDHFLSIGNRVDIEIAEAKRIGCQTCWFRHGEYQYLSPQTQEEKPDYTTEHWQSLTSLLLKTRPTQGPAS